MENAEVSTVNNLMMNGFDHNRRMVAAMAFIGNRPLVLLRCLRMAAVRERRNRHRHTVFVHATSTLYHYAGNGEEIHEKQRYCQIFLKAPHKLFDKNSLFLLIMTLNNFYGYCRSFEEKEGNTGS